MLVYQSVQTTFETCWELWLFLMQEKIKHDTRMEDVVHQFRCRKFHISIGYSILQVAFVGFLPSTIWCSRFEIFKNSSQTPLVIRSHPNRHSKPKCQMYGMFTSRHPPKLPKYTIHGFYGLKTWKNQRPDPRKENIRFYKTESSSIHPNDTSFKVLFLTTIHSLKLTARTWKWMVGSDEFPFGFRPPARCYVCLGESNEEIPHRFLPLSAFWHFFRSPFWCRDFGCRGTPWGCRQVIPGWNWNITPRGPGHGASVRLTMLLRPIDPNAFMYSIF